MKAIGLLCGSGTILYEAAKAGVKVIGNIDDRQAYRTSPWIWEANFPGKPFIQSLSETSLEALGDKWYNADIALGHPPCGSYSRLGHTGVSKDKHDTETRMARQTARGKKMGMMNEFCALVNRFKPKVFALDNLPKMLETAAPPAWWEAACPDYKFTFINMVNYDYGNCQRRHRLWIIGTLHDRPFRFKEPESRLDGPVNAWEAIRDLPWEPWRDIHELAHVHHSVKSKPSGGLYLDDGKVKRRHANFMEEAALGFMGVPNGFLWSYITESGRSTKKAGHCRTPIDGPSRVLTGGETIRHPVTGWPLTPRERARFMGWPDDFKLSTPDTKFDRSMLLKLVRVTGKAVPSEFPRYLMPQLIKHARKIT